jgi:broad specificity phosphatase PhoE
VRLYLIRHGQAGSRDNYDMLSETGAEQARRLGEHLRAAGVTFQAAFAGAMRRQQETARVALGQIPGAPELTIDPRWNEFNLEGLWRSLAPRLLESGGDFAREYEAHAARTDLDRVMTPCDIELIRAWVRNHHACEDVEPWPDFRARVEAARGELARFGPGETVAVFTSATPTAVWCGSALEVDERRIFRIAGVLYNSSYSTLRLSGEELTLFSLNNVPHLGEARLRTFR